MAHDPWNRWAANLSLKDLQEFKQQLENQHSQYGSKGQKFVGIMV
jgi:hypothetical protein